MRVLKIGMAVALFAAASVALVPGLIALRDVFGDPDEMPRWWAVVASAACFLFALAAVIAAVRLFRAAARDS
jgi:hypothetical protein